MPGSELTTASLPIPINYSKSCYSFSDSGKPKKRYLFELDVTFKNRQTKKFSKLEKKQYCTIIDIEDNIEFNDIEKFKITYAEIPFNDENNITVEGKIRHEYSCFELRSNNFYIEFSQNEFGKVICKSYVISENYDFILSISPS